MRSLRPFVAADASTLTAFMAAEGIAADKVLAATSPTFVLDEEGVVMGFFTLTMAHAVPHLVHFVIARAYRTAARARFLARAVRFLVRESGFPRWIMHARHARERRLIEYFWRTQPYALTDDRAFYVVTA